MRFSQAHVPLDGIPSRQHINGTTKLGVAGKLAEGALDPTVHVAGLKLLGRLAEPPVELE